MIKVQASSAHSVKLEALRRMAQTCQQDLAEEDHKMDEKCPPNPLRDQSVDKLLKLAPCDDD